MTNAWEAVRAAIDAEDADAVVTLLTGFDEVRRREVARELPGYLPVARREGERRDVERGEAYQARWEELIARADKMHRQVWELPEAQEMLRHEHVRSRWVEALRVAGAGAIAGAAAVTTWLNKRELERPWPPADVDDVPLILKVVAARPAAWQQDLAVRLALRLRGVRPEAGDGRARLALALLRETGTEPPDHDPLTLAWTASATTTAATPPTSTPSSITSTSTPSVSSASPSPASDSVFPASDSASTTFASAPASTTAPSTTAPASASSTTAPAAASAPSKTAPAAAFAPSSATPAAASAVSTDSASSAAPSSDFSVSPSAVGPSATAFAVSTYAAPTPEPAFTTSADGPAVTAFAASTYAAPTPEPAFTTSADGLADGSVDGWADGLAGDPLLDAMVPRLFSAEGVGRFLRGDGALASALSALATEGRIKRAVLLDGCRSRFLRGGQAADLRFFVGLHDLLDPAPEEVTPHVSEYAAMISLPAANVAELALRQLRRLRVTPPVDAVESLLFRSEGRLVRAGLALLDRVLKEPAEDVDAYASALTAALTCESAEAKTRAVRLAVKHAGRFGPEAAEMIRDTVALLPPGPGAELAGVFGGEAAPEPRRPRFVPMPLPAVPEPPRMPSPITDARVLARLHLPEFDWVPSERWLDGFVRLAAGEHRDELITALSPLAARCRNQHYFGYPWWNTSDWAEAMARELIEPGAERRATLDRRVDATRRVPEMTHAAAWKLMPLARFAEVYQAQTEGRMPPYLLATPTHANGLLDADVLVERLAEYESAGVTALPLDLRQALLRMRRTVTDEAVRQAARLTGPAGRRVHRWLTDRPADPEVVLRWETYQDDTRITSEFVSGPEYAELLGDLLVPRMHEEYCERTLAVFAGHRELAAARSVYTLKSFWPLVKPSSRDLKRLAFADGPGGPGLALLLAHHLLDGPDGDGVRPLLHLAASGGLPGTELGRQLAVLLKRGEDRPSVAIAALSEAARLGAHREVWQVVTGLLPAYLPGPGEKATGVHTRLMRFAVEAAEWADARGELAVVAELAGRSRTTELVRQARRLHAILTSP
ncbi:DUF6493 family protein [Nonomuraea jiangxiensis]|uniref:DUF7824 domain-containing protein n=1 Tax=Nonomuraea jiangxiensis TaxID=633440 RepID=A0A1G9DB60_9ACTN|nr:DUF6493 family protein [Nonomuraea jiangxiensis]SDK61024.1 hypothetical protein SAMN05421869_11766 [Nonomuraea jiangxiensis]